MRVAVEYMGKRFLWLRFPNSDTPHRIYTWARSAVPKTRRHPRRGDVYEAEVTPNEEAPLRARLQQLWMDYPDRGPVDLGLSIDQWKLVA